MAEVGEAKLHLESLWYNVAYIWIYGSQNYGLAEYSDEYMSDIDFKAVIVPSLDDLVFNSKPISTTLVYWDGQIDLKDIRTFAETLSKCNPVYMESLYTPYLICSDDYKFIINEREQLMGEMGSFFMKASYGMIMEKIKAFSHPYPATENRIDEFGYDPKQLHHIIRIAIIMKEFVNSWTYDMSLTDEEREELMNIKKGSLSLEDAIICSEANRKIAYELKENYLIEPKFNSKKRIITFSKDLIKKEIIDNIKGKKKVGKLDSPFNGYCPVCWLWCVMDEMWSECNKCKTRFKPLPDM